MPTRERLVVGGAVRPNGLSILSIDFESDLLHPYFGTALDH
jgi:hypothetical protein